MKILRFLYANNWKLEKSYKSIISYTEWSKEKLPPKLTKSTKEFLVLIRNYKENLYDNLIRSQACSMSMAEIIDSGLL